MADQTTPTSEAATKLVASVAAEQLGIKAVTLRKYSTMVEKQLNDDTRFRTSDTRHRLYTAADLATFKAAIQLTEQGATLAAALQQTFDGNTSQPANVTPVKQPVKTPTTTTSAPATSGPSNDELAKQQAIIIRRLDSLNYRMNLVLERLEAQANHQAAKPWWQFWR